MTIDVDAFLTLFDALGTDVKTAIELVGTTERSQFARRTYVRTLFAYVEGWINLSKQALVEETALHVVPLTIADSVVLREESHEVADDGSVVTRQRFIPLHKNVRLVFSLSAKYFGGANVLDASSADWRAFRKAIEIRNRLMHPRKPSDLDVLDDELETIITAQKWFFMATIDLQDRAWEALGGKESDD